MSHPTGPIAAANLRGAAFMTVSMGTFALNDGAVKAVLADLPLFEVLLLRGLFASAILAVLCWRTGAFRWRPGRRDRRLILLRGTAEIATTLTFLTALANMPIAAATAILQSAPLVVTLAAAAFLGEVVGWRRYLAATIGFLGVLIVIRPGAADFNIYALLAVLTVLFIAVRDLITRRLSPEVPSLPVALVTSVFITATGAAGSLATDLSIPDARHVGLLAMAAVVLVMGYVFGVMAMRVGEIAFVSPFRYTILIYALVIGIVAFGEIPDSLTVLGSAIIVATGLFTFWRERRTIRRRARETVLRR